ncbi:hypothetical protein [Chthonobacter rhizosphaerae]|uniref:hypothetical protein n=1 Tax=Chthonobacter rhizosphaerae TaxID=2735553 RepID=UPI0015EF22F6|nr:hypothetical protein [Chthonobacter rhizosphaerae]
MAFYGAYAVRTTPEPDALAVATGLPVAAAVGLAVAVLTRSVVTAVRAWRNDSHH